MMKPMFTAAIALVAAVSAAPTSRVPRVIHHPRPSLNVSSSGFTQELTGCAGPLTDSRSCQSSTLQTLGCTSLSAVDPLLGGLEPAYPVAWCLISFPKKPPQPSEYLFGPQGIMSIWSRYVIVDHGKLRLIRNHDELRATFAPIKSADEALSYALAMTRLVPIYGIAAPAGFRYFTGRLEDTFVTATASGWRVHLFDPRVFGCGPHTMYSADVEVTADGTIRPLEETKLFEDPKQDNLCVD